MGKMKAKSKFVHFRYLFYPFMALLFGIVTSRKLFAGDILTCVLVPLIFVGLVAICMFFRKFKPLILLTVFFLLGNGFYFLGLACYDCKDYEGESIVIGRVTDEVRDYGYYSMYKLDSVLINGEGAKNIYLHVSGGQLLEAGDKVTFIAETTKVKLFELGSFNSTYLRNNIGYTAEVDYSSITVVDNNLKFDESLRLSVKNMLYENMSEENAAIAYAVLFGDKYDIPSSTKDIYRDAGIIHILTVSGLHVGFLISLLYFFLNLCKMKRLYTTIITSVILLLYNIICGFAPSIVRASIMAMVIMLSKLSGREYDSLNSLGLAGFIILAINPLYAFDSGFLMSFFCVTSIFMLNPPLSKLFKKIMPKPISTYISLSISAQIGILPFVASFFQNFNFLSFFANLIILPIFGIIYPVLFISIFIFLIMPFLSKGLVVFDYGFSGITGIAKFFASTSLTIPLYPFDITFSILLFVLLFLLSRFLMVRKIYKFLALGILSLFFVIAVVVSSIPITLGSGVRSLNTDYMDSLLISTSTGQTAFIYKSLDEQRLKQYLYVNKISNIDYVVLTHQPSESEINYFEKYNIKKFLCNEGEPSGLVAVGEIFNYGAMTFKFQKDEKKLQGCEINFDGSNIFVVTSGKMSYNEIELFSQNYNLVCTWDNFYHMGERGMECAAYKKEGNLSFSWNGFEWKKRGID